MPQIVAGISTESIPPIFSAGRRYPVDQLGLVGPWDKTEQSVLPGSDKKNNNETDPSGFPRVIQINRWMKAQWASMSHETRWVQTECFTQCDSDQPVADGPVDPSGIVGPVDPGRIFSQCKPDQPVALGPVGQLFTTGPVGPCGMVSNHELHDPIADSPVGLTETPNPVDETERPIQIDFMKIVQTDGPVSLVDTPLQVTQAYTVGENNGKI